MKSSMRFRLKALAAALLTAAVAVPATSMAATQEAIQQSIDDGLAWLASTQNAGGYWPYSDNGAIAATASAALAFIEEGYLPGDGSAYDSVVTGAVNYVFNQARVDTHGWDGDPWVANGTETAGYTRIAEDYNNNGANDDGGNNRAVYFYPGNNQRNLYTTGVVTPMVHALGDALGPNTVISSSNAVVNGQTYNQLMQDVVDWFSWGQVDPDRGVHRGGWRYDANYWDSDNSTAQWGSLPMLYVQASQEAGSAWSLGQPQYVADELGLYTAYIQNANGGSGYSTPNNYVNVSKTGGLILEFLAQQDATNAQIQAALNFINGRWNNGPNGWYGNLNQPYAMWAVYKALGSLGMLATDDNGTADPADDYVIGFGMPNAPGGFTIGYAAAPQTSLAGDWYSHYSDLLVSLQNANGSWNGYYYWTGALATGWYINILNATGAPPVPPNTAPEPSTLALLATGLIGAGAMRRRRRKV